MQPQPTTQPPSRPDWDLLALLAQPPQSMQPPPPPPPQQQPQRIYIHQELQRGAWVDYDSYIIKGKEYRSHVVDDPIFGNVSHFAFGIKKASSQARLAFHISARVGQPPAVGVLGRRRERGEERSLARGRPDGASRRYGRLGWACHNLGLAPGGAMAACALDDAAYSASWVTAGI
jgi:hypothetical protein